VQYPGQFAPVFAVRGDQRGEVKFRLDRRAAQDLLQAIAEG